MPTQNVGPGSEVDLQAIADTIGRSKKVLVVTGAGISTNCGIPDFRSENGLYSMIQAQYDAALLNPPWERDRDEYDIDDRPMKKRKRWFYEVVRADGTVVDVIDSDVSTTEVAAPIEVSPKSSRAPSPNFHQQSAEPKDCSSPLSSIATSILDAPSGFHSIAPSTASTRSQSPVESTISQSPPISSQTSQSGAESSQASRPDLPNLKGRDLFDSMVWKDSFTTSIFYMFVSSLRLKISENVKDTTSTHKLIRAFQEGGRLLRNYTQNIDSLEEREEMSTDLALGQGSRSRFYAKIQRQPRPQPVSRDSDHYGGVSVVQLHGSLERLRCTLCSKLADWTKDRLDATLAGTAPECPACLSYTTERTGRGRRGLAVGTLRPDIVLYGEEHPHATIIGNLVEHDIKLCPDVLLILGTSLKVHGLKRVIKEFANAVHTRGGKVIFVNHTKPPESTWGDVIDYWIGWDCDAWVLDLKTRRPDIWFKQGDSRLPKESKTMKDSGGSGGSKKPADEADDEECGVFQTFKILDLLGKYHNGNGQTAQRPLHLPSQAYNLPIPRPPNKRKSTQSMVAMTTLVKAAEKSTSKSNHSHKNCKSYPRALREDKRNIEYLTSRIWEHLRTVKPGFHLKSENGEETLSSRRPSFGHNHPHLPPSIREWVGNLRKSVPSLREAPPQPGRLSFEELSLTAPTYIREWAAEHPDIYRDTVSTYIPNLSSYTPPSNPSKHLSSSQIMRLQTLNNHSPSGTAPVSTTNPINSLALSQSMRPIPKYQTSEMLSLALPPRFKKSNDQPIPPQSMGDVSRQTPKLPRMASFSVQAPKPNSGEQRRKTLSGLPIDEPKSTEQFSETRSMSMSRNRACRPIITGSSQNPSETQLPFTSPMMSKASLPRQTGACGYCYKKKIRCRKHAQCEYVKLGGVIPLNADAFELHRNAGDTVTVVATPVKRVSVPLSAVVGQPVKNAANSAELFKPKPKPIERKIVHAYGTRGSQRWTIAESPIIADTPATMSSPETSVNSSKDVFYDAEETTAEGDSPS